MLSEKSTLKGKHVKQWEKTNLEQWKECLAKQEIWRIRNNTTEAYSSSQVHDHRGFRFVELLINILRKHQLTYKTGVFYERSAQCALIPVSLKLNDTLYAFDIFSKLVYTNQKHCKIKFDILNSHRLNCKWAFGRLKYTRSVKCLNTQSLMFVFIFKRRCLPLLTVRILMRP